MILYSRASIIGAGKVSNLFVWLCDVLLQENRMSHWGLPLVSNNPLSQSMNCHCWFLSYTTKNILKQFESGISEYLDSEQSIRIILINVWAKKNIAFRCKEIFKSLELKLYENRISLNIQNPLWLSMFKYGNDVHIFITKNKTHYLKVTILGILLFEYWHLYMKGTSFNKFLGKFKSSFGTMKLLSLEFSVFFFDFILVDLAWLIRK